MGLAKPTFLWFTDHSASVSHVGLRDGGTQGVGRATTNAVDRGLG